MCRTTHEFCLLAENLPTVKGSAGHITGDYWIQRTSIHICIIVHKIRHVSNLLKILHSRHLGFNGGKCKTSGIFSQNNKMSDMSLWPVCMQLLNFVETVLWLYTVTSCTSIAPTLQKCVIYSLCLWEWVLFLVHYWFLSLTKQWGTITKRWTVIIICSGF
jgi:hypothetical protein